MFKAASLLALISLIPALARAQQGVWAQCGGINWTGGTTCVSGSVCTYSNPYYSQCLPVSSTTAATTSTTTTTTTSHATTTTTTTSTTSHTGTTTSTSTSATSTSTAAAGDPFTGYTYFLSPPYTSEVQAAAANITNSATQALALDVAQIPTFIWFDQIAKVPNLSTYLSAAQDLQTSSGQKYIVPIVIYDLPDRDCAADASNGEFTIADNGVADYYNYIDEIAAAIQAYPDVRVVAVVEPDSLANLVTNLSVQKCADAESAYLQCITYAMQTLNPLGNVYMYLDAGHAGWLGWPANLSPAAQLFSSLYSNAGSPSMVRGLATNVANYNSFNTSTPDPITSGNPNYDELLYIQALAPLLTSSSFPAHFIVDQSRSGVQDIRNAWGDWCNVKGAGFGIRPSTNTGTSLVDAFVWVKPGGECDGTSNTSALRYDPHCGYSDALQPAPEAGTWFQDYFVDLVTNANPAL